MKNEKETKNILSDILSVIKFTIILLLLYMYVEKWIKSAKEGNWLVFSIMSIIPIMMIYCLIENYNNNNNNIYGDMIDAQIDAWEKQ